MVIGDHLGFELSQSLCDLSCGLRFGSLPPPPFATAPSPMTPLDWRHVVGRKIVDDCAIDWRS
jgi:hypothetical protein